METKIGLLVSGGERDQLRFSLLKKSSPSGDQLWPSVPIIFALNRESGKVQHFDQTLPDKELERVVQSLAALTKNGPHPPSAILDIISRETYAGIWRFGVRIGSTRDKRPKEEWIEIAVPPLVDRKIWETAQELRAEQTIFKAQRKTRLSFERPCLLCLRVRDGW